MGFLSGIGDVFKSAGNIGKSLASGLGGVGKGLSSIFGLTIPRIPGLSGITGGLGSILGGLGPLGAGIGGISDLMATPPSPEDEGRRLGRIQRSFFKEAYPGTNPWEQLGTQGLGGATAATAERVNKRTLSNQKEIAEISARAAVAPELIRQFPEKAADVYNNLNPERGSVGPNLTGALSERQFAFQKEMQSLQRQIELANVDVKVVEALTRRFALQLENRKFDFEQNVKVATTELKNKEVAYGIVNALSRMYDAMGSNPWKTGRAAIDAAFGKAGGSTFLDAMMDAVRLIPAQPTQPPRRIRQPTSGPPPGGR